MDEDEYEGYKSWYLYYKDQANNPNPRVPVPVDVDFDVELVRTDRINVVYILNLLKRAHDASNLSAEQLQANADLILREIERSDNVSLRAKKDIMRAFIETRFYDLPEEADMQQAFEEFEKEQLQADIETFSYNNGIDTDIVIDIFTDYSFSGGVSDEAIRRRLMAYHFGLLKITKLTNDIRGFVVNTYNKYRAEGE